MSWVSWPCRNAAASGPEISTMARSSSLAATSGKEFMDVILLKSVELLKPVGLSKPVKPMKSVELSKPVKQGGHSVYDSGLWPGCVEMPCAVPACLIVARFPPRGKARSEEHTSELQSLMRISYAVFCLKQKKHHIQI